MFANNLPFISAGSLQTVVGILDTKILLVVVVPMVVVVIVAAVDPRFVITVDVVASL